MVHSAHPSPSPSHSNSVKLEHFPFYIVLFHVIFIRYTTLTELCCVFQIDESVIRLRDDKELETYIPKYGDMDAISAFVKAASSGNQDDHDSGAVIGKKLPLVERLRERTFFTLHRAPSRGNKNAPKQTHQE